MMIIIVFTQKGSKPQSSMNRDNVAATEPECHMRDACAASLRGSDQHPLRSKRGWVWIQP